MGFDAGEVTATLGGRFNPAGFLGFGKAMGKAKVEMEAGEAAIAAASAKSVSHSNRLSAASAALGVQTGRASQATKALGGVVGVTALGVGGLGIAIALSARKAADFEKAMSEVKAIAKPTTAQFKQLGDAAKTLGARTGVGATQAAGAIAELAKGGLSASQIIGGALTGAIALAQAGGLELGAAASATANTLNQFALKGEQATHVADALATAANATTFDVHDLTQALAQGGGAANAAGLSFDQTVVAIEALSKQTSSGSDAGTSLKTALLQVLQASKQGKGPVKELAGAFFDQHGKIKDLASISTVLRDKLGGLTSQQRLQTLQSLAGTDGFRALLALYNEGPKKLEAYEKGLQKQGTAADVAAKKQDNVQGAIRRLGAAFESAQIDIGSAVLPELADGADKAAGAIRKLQESGDLAKFGHVAAGALQLVVGAFSGIVSAIAGAIPGIKAQLDDFLGIISTLGRGLLALAKGANVIPGVHIDTSGLEDAIDDIDHFREKLREKPPPPLKLKVVTDSTSAINALRQLEGSKLGAKVLKVLADDGSAKAKIRALIALGIPPKTARLIVAGAEAAGGKVRSLAGLIASLRDRTIRITTLFQQIGSATAGAKGLSQSLPGSSKSGGVGSGGGRRGAAGFGPGTPALVGEGAVPREAIIDPASGVGFIVDSPTVLDLPDSAYVIPQDQRHRGRAMGLLGDLAADLGLQGFALGKGPKKKKKKKNRKLPGHVDPLSFDPEELDKRADNERARYDQLVTDSQEKDKNNHATKKAKAAKAKVAAERRLVQVKRADARKARSYAARITKQDELADIASDAMTLADKRDDDGKYNQARTDRGKALKESRRLLHVALTHAPKGSSWARALQKRIGGLDNEILDNSVAAQDAAADVETEADRIADTGLTDAERAALGGIDKDISLAALTQGLEDDKGAAGRKVDLLRSALGALVGGGRPATNDAIREVADQLKSAQDNLASFSPSATGSNDSADVQAQIDQDLARKANDALEGRAATAALTAFLSTGDIGTGARTAYEAAGGVTFNFASLVPYNQQQATEVAGHVVSGLSGQQARTSSVANIGY